MKKSRADKSSSSNGRNSRTIAMRAEQPSSQAVNMTEWPGALAAAKGVGLKDWQLTVVEVVKDGE